MINKCTCHSPYQDKKYGPGNRVFNRLTRGKEGKTKGIARCTVCGFVLQSSANIVIVKEPDAK